MAKFKFKTNSEKKKLKIFHCADVIDSGKKISGSRIEMISNRELSLDGCRAILEYNDVYIRLKIIGGEITVVGSALDIPVYDGPQITVTGEIKTIDFSVR